MTLMSTMIFHHFGSHTPLPLARRPLRRATQAPLGQPWPLGTSEKNGSGADMLHLMPPLQNN